MVRRFCLGYFLFLFLVSNLLLTTFDYFTTVVVDEKLGSLDLANFCGVLQIVEIGYWTSIEFTTLSENYELENLVRMWLCSIILVIFKPKSI